MSEAWRIDSLDVRAGLAFASWRDPDLDSGVLQLERAAVFLSPPNFRPEAVANRATGFSAGRGQAQLGVFIDDSELAFESLEDLTEFVRRAYLSSGGGDAGGEGGGGGRPRAPSRPDDGLDIGGGESPESEGPSGARAVVAAAQKAHDMAQKQQLQQGLPTPVARLFLDSEVTQSAGWTSGNTLAGGAAELLLEFLRRYPRTGNTDQILKWCEGAQRLGGAIAGMGLWPSILESWAGTSLDSAGDQIARTLTTPPQFPIGRNLIPSLFEGTQLAWSGMHPGFAEELLYYSRRYGVPFGWGGGFRREGDPVDDLNAWPLPREVADLVGSGQNDVTALHLLSAVSGTPGKLANTANGLVAIRAASILLFSVAHILDEANPRSSFSWLLPDVHSAGLAEMGGRSLAWMFRQWPSLIFPQVVEDVIGSAARLRAA